MAYIIGAKIAFGGLRKKTKTEWPTATSLRRRYNIPFRFGTLGPSRDVHTTSGAMWVCSSFRTISHCKPLLHAVLGGINRRFSNMVGDNKQKIVAGSNLKLIWVEEDAANEHISILKLVVRRVKSNSNHPE